MKTFENWLQGKMLGSMEKEFARDAWNAAIEAMRAESEPVGVTIQAQLDHINSGLHPDIPMAFWHKEASYIKEPIPLYTHPQPLRELSEDELNRMWGKAIAEGQWGAFVRFAKLVREAK